MTLARSSPGDSNRRQDRSLLIGLTVTIALAIVVLLLYCFKGAFRRKRRRRFAYPRAHHGNMSSTGLLPLKNSTTSLLPVHDVNAMRWKSSVLIGLLGSPTWEANLKLADEERQKARSAYSSTATSHYSTAKTGTSNNSIATHKSALTEFGHLSDISKVSTTLRATSNDHGQRNYLGPMICIPDPILDPAFPPSTYQLPTDEKTQRNETRSGRAAATSRNSRPSRGHGQHTNTSSFSAKSPPLSHSSNPFFKGNSAASLSPKPDYVTNHASLHSESSISKVGKPSHRETHSTNSSDLEIPGPIPLSNAVEEAIAFLRSPPRSLSKAPFQSPTIVQSSHLGIASNTRDMLRQPSPKPIFHSPPDNALPLLPDIPGLTPTEVPTLISHPIQSKPRAVSARQRSSSVGPSPLRNMTLPEASSHSDVTERASALNTDYPARNNPVQKPYGSVGRGLPSRSQGAAPTRQDSDWTSYRRTSEPRKVSFGDVDPLSAMLRDLAQEASQWDESVYVNDEFKNLMQRASSGIDGIDAGLEAQYDGDSEVDIDLALYELEPTYRDMRAIQEDSQEAVSSMPSPERTPEVSFVNMAS